MNKKQLRKSMALQKLPQRIVLLQLGVAAAWRSPQWQQEEGKWRGVLAMPTNCSFFTSLTTDSFANGLLQRTFEVWQQGQGCVFFCTAQCKTDKEQCLSTNLETLIICTIYCHFASAVQFSSLTYVFQMTTKEHKSPLSSVMNVIGRSIL